MSGHDTKFVQRRNGQKTIARPRLEPSIGVFTEKLDTEGQGVMPMSASGHSRRFDDWPITSGVPQLTDIPTVSRYVSNVPIAKCPPVASAAPGGHGGVSAVLAQRLPTR
jgi:hypothetical protein